MPTSFHLAAVATLLLASCSLNLDWNVEGLPCNGPDQECSGTYSCLDGKCIKFGSRELGQSCEADVQCNSGNLCPTGVCAAPCDIKTAYTASSCSAGQYCGAFLSHAGYTTPGGAAAPTWVAACVDSAVCSPGTPCSQQPNGTCVLLSTAQQLQACLPGCSVQNTNGVIKSTCVADYYPRSCTPLGEAGSQQLVCLNVGTAPLPLGESCNAAASPCHAEDACIKGVCRSYCQLGTSSPGASGCINTQPCCTAQLNPALQVGYCADTCP